jgi:hypothetical protein
VWHLDVGAAMPGAKPDDLDHPLTLTLPHEPTELLRSLLVRSNVVRLMGHGHTLGFCLSIETWQLMLFLVEAIKAQDRQRISMVLFGDKFSNHPNEDLTFDQVFRTELEELKYK